MKKVLLFIVTLLAALTFSFSSVAYAEQIDDYKLTSTYVFIKDFTDKFPDRKAGIAVNNVAESPLQKYLSDEIVFRSNGRLSANDVTYQAFSIDGVNQGYNIVARFDKKDTDKQIIIGAHYDSDIRGANDNASGVAALLRILNKLSVYSDVLLPCDIVFVLFDAEELGMLGSYSYVGRMSQAEKENTLVMINMDSIANGDNLYVWCENKRTDLADLILRHSDKLIEKPYAIGTYNLDNGRGYGYVEVPQNSDQTPFRVEGIPTALFFSGTYSANIWNYAESENPAKNTMNTSADTLENLDKYSGAEFVAKINATADAICDTIMDADFVTIAETQRGQLVNLKVWGNSWWASLICGVVLAAFIVAALLYYRKLQKGAILGTAEIKNNKVFSTPDAKDIFSFDEKKSSDKMPPIEDVFTINDKNNK